MQQGKTIWLSLSYWQPLYEQEYHTDLYLPMNVHEVRDILQKLRAETISDPAIEITILDSDVIPTLETMRLDTTSILELDYLAERIVGLNERERIAFQALVVQLTRSDDSGLISVKDLINMTYNLESVPILENMHFDAQLGEHLIANNLVEEIAVLPEEVKSVINRTELGRIRKEKDQGFYVSGNYVIAGNYQRQEIYDGVNLPLKKAGSSFVFGFEIARGPKYDETAVTDTPEWLYLPSSKKRADEIARRHGESCIEDCVYLGFKSAIPQITEDLLGDLNDFDKYSTLAARYGLMSLEERCVFKAVISAERPKDIDELLDITEHLCLYEFSPKEANYSDFFREYVSRYLDTRFDKEWLQQISVRNAGRKLIEKVGASITEYGAISARGRKLYELVPYREENAESQAQETEEETDVEVGIKM